MYFRRQSKSLVLGQTILDSPCEIPFHPKAYIEDIDDLRINIGRYSLRKLLRIMISDIVRVHKYGMGLG